MNKFFRAFKAEQRKLWSKSSILGCFVSIFVLSFVLSFLCSVIRNSGIDPSGIFITEHSEAAFAVFDERTPWKDQINGIIEECDKEIADTAVLLTDAEGSARVVYERQMAQLVREKAVAEYRLEKALPLRDWTGYYSLVLCLWLMIPAAGVMASVFASDIFAGEYSRGTIRMIFSRPVTRIKIYLAKLMTSLLLGWLLLGVSYAAAGIGCGVLMSPSDGVYVGYRNGSVYSTTWSTHLFTVFLCGCGMIAVVIALCAAVGTITRSRGASAAAAVTMALAGMATAPLSGVIDSRIVGLLLPFCYDLTIPLCGVAYNSECDFISCILSLGIHFLVFVVAGYSGMKRDV